MADIPITKLSMGKCRLAPWKILLTRAVSVWNRYPSEVLESLPLCVLQYGRDGAFSELGATQKYINQMLHMPG